MIPDAEVRVATADDAGVVTTLLAQLGYPQDPVAVARWLGEHAGADAEAVLVVHEGAVVVGVAAVAVVELFPELTRQGRVTALVVRADRRDQGVGHRLLWGAEVWLRDHGCSHVELVTRRGAGREIAHGFYPAKGYADTDRVVYRKAL